MTGSQRKPLTPEERALLTDPARKAEASHFSFEGRKITDLTLRDLSFQGGDWSGAEFHEVRFHRCQLQSIKANDATFAQCSFEQSSLVDSRFMRTAMTQGRFISGSVINCGWRECQVEDCALQDVQVGNISMRSSCVSLKVTGGALQLARFEAGTLELRSSGAKVATVRISSCQSKALLFEGGSVEGLEVWSGRTEKLAISRCEASRLQCSETEIGSLELWEVPFLVTLNIVKAKVGLLSCIGVHESHDLYIKDSHIAELRVQRSSLSGFFDHSQLGRGLLNAMTLADWFWDESTVTGLTLEDVTLQGGLSARGTHFRALRLRNLHVPKDFQWALAGARFEDSDRFPDGHP